VGEADACRLRITGPGGEPCGDRTERLASGARTVRFDLEVPGARLWSPETPVLYRARLELCKGEHPIDAEECRFGIRQIETDGWRFKLNGHRLFLRGYGDDAVYPETMAAPSDKRVYLKRLSITRSFGFNYVRHHSHMLPPEYYEAADEVGMLVSAEFPIAYYEYYNRAKGAALELYQSEWAAAIRRLRNHPSIFDWCMGNELYDSTPLGPGMYAAAKQLDPLRLVIDSDGLSSGAFLSGRADRPTLDYYAIQFNCHALPLDQPDKHAVAGEPNKPVICHETGNYTTFPRPGVIPAFRHNMKPFWLTPMRDRLERAGLLPEADLWADRSERLYLLSHKLNLEDLRKSPRISGYTWWLFQEYWTGTNGIVDHYFQPKGIRSEQVLPFNNDIVLLQNGFEANLRAARMVNLSLLVSNGSPEPLQGAKLTCVLRLGDRELARRELAVAAGQGDLVEVGTWAPTLPEVAAPGELVLSAELAGAGLRRTNSWTARLYPSTIALSAPAVPVYAGSDLLEPLGPYGVREMPADETLPSPAVYVVSQPDVRTLGAATRGSCLVCLTPDLVFPSVPNRFKPAWWLGNGSDCNLGTVVYENPVTKGTAPEGWCDAGWYGLLEGARAFLLDGMPVKPSVLVRAIDLHTICRSKALLFEAGAGEGTIIVSGLNWRLRDGREHPEAAWLMTRLLAHAATLPRAATTLPPEYLRERIAMNPVPPPPYVNGFARLIASAEREGSYPNWRGGMSPLHICRQNREGNPLQWETAPVPPRTGQGGPVILVFGGGLGWQSQPSTSGFSLWVNGREMIAFDLAREARKWASPDNRATLSFEPKVSNAEDTMGLFYLSLPGELAPAGRPCRIEVRSRGTGSRRWFGLTEWFGFAE
jgi:hypothetical protein